ncbi:MAG: nucleotidyltransferase domain-containing protein [Candidatus Woesearchaeota archaeon]
MFKELNNLRVFLEDPERKIHVREYAKLFSITPATASKLLNIFAQKGFLQKEIVQNIHFYSLRKTQVTKDLKVFYTIQKIREIIPQLDVCFGKPTIVLFGSTSKGEDVPTSDIDLYIESEVKKVFDVKKVEKQLGKSVQLFVYQNIAQVPNKHLRQSIVNGIVLQGEIRGIK